MDQKLKDFVDVSYFQDMEWLNDRPQASPSFHGTDTV